MHGYISAICEYINYDTVYNLVLINLRKVLWNYRNNTQKFYKILEKKYETDCMKEYKELKNEYEKKQRMIARSILVTSSR